MNADRVKFIVSVCFWIALAVLLGVAVMTHQNTLRLLNAQPQLADAAAGTSSQIQTLRTRATWQTMLFIVGTLVSVAVLLVVFLILTSQISASQLAEESLAREKLLLEWQCRRQAAMAEIELAINEPHELQALLQRIVERVTELLPATAASVIVWDSAQADFAVSATTVPRQLSQTASQRVRRAAGATRWIMDHKKPLVVRDARDDPFEPNPMLTEFGLQSYAGVPLIAAGTPLGVLYALDRQVRDYLAADLDFLTALAGRAAVALAKVQHFDKLQDRNDELELRVQERTTELRRSNTALARSQELVQSAIDALSAHVAVIDEQSTILTVNRAWREFADQNGFRAPDHGVGLNYLAACDRATSRDAEDAAEVAAGLRAVLNGTRTEFRYEYPCDSPTEERWFQMRISRLAQREPVRLAIAHENVTEIKRSQESLRVLSGRLMQLRDEERRHIARELHDSTGQNLAAIALNLARLQKLLPPDAAQPGTITAESLALAEQCQREIRTLSYLLHPPMLEEAGLVHAVRWFVDGFAKRSDIPVDVITVSGIGRLPAEIERTLFRIVQEGLSNIHRHAHCTRASIQLLREDRQILMEIKDDGNGFPDTLAAIIRKPTAPIGVGIMGMRERLRQLGGRLEIESGPHGTRLHARIPLEKTAT